jgi:hypothetical protein
MSDIMLSHRAWNGIWCSIIEVTPVLMVIMNQLKEHGSC